MDILQKWGKNHFQGVKPKLKILVDKSKVTCDNAKCVLNLSQNVVAVSLNVMSCLLSNFVHKLAHLDKGIALGKKTSFEFQSRHTFIQLMNIHEQIFDAK